MRGKAIVYQGLSLEGRPQGSRLPRLPTTTRSPLTSATADRALSAGSRIDGAITAGIASFLALQKAPLPEGAADLISSASWSRNRTGVAG